jgi:DNA-binding GntR family transcriptional regulator
MSIIIFILFILALMATSSIFFPSDLDATASAEALRQGQTTISLRQHVSEVLRAAIVQGVFQPGEQLSDKRLCEFTGASRPLIREAVRQLEGEGYITALPFRRPTVANLSWPEIVSLLELREALEPQAAGLAATRASPAQIDRMGKALQELFAANTSAIVNERLAAKDLFYGVLLESAASNEIAAAIARAHQRMKLARLARISTLSRATEAYEELQRIYEAVRDQDVPRAKEAAIAHIQAAKTSVERLYLDEQHSR